MVPMMFGFMLAYLQSLPKKVQSNENLVCNSGDKDENNEESESICLCIPISKSRTLINTT